MTGTKTILTRIVPISILLCALLLMTGCQQALPEFTLAFEVTSAGIIGSTGNTLVTCTLDNIGGGDMKNVMVEIACIVPGSEMEVWTEGVDLSSGDSRTVMTTFNGITINGEDNFIITATGWDQ